MMQINLIELQAFLGWCSVINICLLTLSFLSLTLFKKQISVLHSRLMGIEPAQLTSSYFNLLAVYKLMIVVFNIVPYFALQLIG